MNQQKFVRLILAACIVFLVAETKLQAQIELGWNTSPPVSQWQNNAPQRLPAPSSPGNGNGITAVDYEYYDQTQPQPEVDLVPPSSRPSEFEIGPDTAEAGNDPNIFAGNPPVQDMSSLYPGRFTNTKYKWYGFVRLDSIFDFNPIVGTDSFVTSAIPIPQGRGQNFAMNPRYSRLGFDTETPLDEIDWNIKTRIEVDFFNGNNSGAFGSFPLRLRFAWIDFGPFLVGQTASLFMDYDVFPNVLDYQGPPGMVLVRQPIAAIRIPLGDCTKLSFGVEQPYSDIQWFDGAAWVVNPGTGIIAAAGVDRNVQDAPDFTGNIRQNWTYGHLQVAGILRQLSFQPAVGPTQDETGYGINITGTWHPWANLMGSAMCEDKTPLERSRFLAQYATGEGINRYIQDVNGFGLDAIFDPANGFRTISSTGWFLAYEHWWTDYLISNFTYSESNSNVPAVLPATTYQTGQYATANLIWLPMERMGVGIEYLYGTRENLDGQSGTARRLQMGVQYKF